MNSFFMDGIHFEYDAITQFANQGQLCIVAFGNPPKWMHLFIMCKSWELRVAGRVEGKILAQYAIAVLLRKSKVKSAECICIPAGMRIVCI